MSYPHLPAAKPLTVADLEAAIEQAYAAEAADQALKTAWCGADFFAAWERAKAEQDREDRLFSPAGLRGLFVGLK